MDAEQREYEQLAAKLKQLEELLETTLTIKRATKPRKSKRTPNGKYNFRFQFGG